MHLRAWLALGIASFLTALVALLAVSPPYSGLASGLDLQPARLFAPLHTYLFRNAVVNSGWLLLGVYPLALLLGWTWAITGIPRPARPLLLLPLFLSSPLIGLLWRPLFAAWLDLAQAEIALAITALVILWRAVPMAAWLFSEDRHAWPKLFALCALLILLDAALVLTLTHGEPFNAAHTWASWTLQQLWVSRAWGYAASMAAGGAVLVAMTTWLASLRTAPPAAIDHGSPLGNIAAFAWSLGPFIMPLLALLQAPVPAMTTLVNLGVITWLFNGALLWGGATLLAARFAWRLPTARARRLTRTLTLAMLPISTVALAYLVDQWPILGSRWLLMALTSLFTAGLLMGNDHVPSSRSSQWAKAAGYTLLVMAHTFPLQLVMHLPAQAWTPALGIVWTLGDAPQSTAALGAALLLCGAGAGVGAWLVTYKEDVI
ncbi:MAG: hypothetical protein IT328_21090 [Caldilineaceae bacterium]|nr:hypothetical protein [Caldilineaceae bacterium]